MEELGCAESIVDDVYRAFDIASLISVLDAENEFSVLGFGKQICKSAVRRFPICMYPVGLGANRVLTISLIMYVKGKRRSSG